MRQKIRGVRKSALADAGYNADRTFVFVEIIADEMFKRSRERVQ